MKVSAGELAYFLAAGPLLVDAAQKLMTSDFLRVGRIEDFPPGVIRGFQDGGLNLAVVNWRERFYAFFNHCTHLGYPLDQGGFITPDGELICTSHFACFDIATGKLIDGPGYSALAVFDVSVQDGEVLVARLPRQD